MEMPWHKLFWDMEMELLKEQGHNNLNYSLEDDDNEEEALLVLGDYDDSDNTKNQRKHKRCKIVSDSNSNSSIQGRRVKKVRNCAESLGHIMAERKRRQQLTERFIALSATIPGLKKLEERIKKLEDERSSSSRKIREIRVESASVWVPPESSVEARALENQLLLRIHCNKHSSGVMLNILAHLPTLHLSLITTTVLPFGTSSLHITIIAQMGDKHKANVKDIVRSMRMSLLGESPTGEE